MMVAQLVRLIKEYIKICLPSEDIAYLRQKKNHFRNVFQLQK
jgi:predicted phosphatase